MKNNFKLACNLGQKMFSSMLLSTASLFCKLKQYSQVVEELEYRDSLMWLQAGIPPAVLAQLNASKVPVQSVSLWTVQRCKTALGHAGDLAGSLTDQRLNVAS